MKAVLIIFCIAVLALFQSCNREGASERKPPNIIFILTDDQRWDALGYAGNPIIQTPHMDELARSGLYFQNAFVTTPICAASRAYYKNLIMIFGLFYIPWGLVRFPS